MDNDWIGCRVCDARTARGNGDIDADCYANADIDGCANVDPATDIDHCANVNTTCYANVDPGRCADLDHCANLDATCYADVNHSAGGDRSAHLDANADGDTRGLHSYPNAVGRRASASGSDRALSADGAERGFPRPARGRFRPHLRRRRRPR